MKVKDDIRTWGPAVLPVLAVVALQLACYWIPAALLPASGRILIDSPIDDAIPFVPAFVVLYLGAFIQWIIYFLRLACAEPALRYRYLAAEIVAALIGCACFVACPVSLVRPDAAGAGPFLWLVRIVYGADDPVCLFPSFHAVVSSLATLRVFDDSRAGTPAKVGSVLFTVGVCASAVFVKQHLLMDMVAGVALALACRLLARKTPLSQAVGRLFDALNAKVFGTRV
mgnify:CR=1 FL=1